MVFKRAVLFFCLLSFNSAFLFASNSLSSRLPSSAPTPAPSEENLDPIWEYGLGLGFVRFEEYPAAGKHTQIFIPFPTFQYRGQVLRADDREGAKAYLWVQGPWTLEISGTGSPALDSDKNEARRGMEDLPWIIAAGPEVVYRFNGDVDLTFAAYQALATDFQSTTASGAIFETKLTYLFETHFENKVRSLTKYFLSFKSASQEVQQQYYGVDAEDVTSVRPAFRARAGFLGTELSIFQSFKRGHLALYFGGNYTLYSFAENKESPLHLAPDQFSFLFGVTYVLSGSKKPEVTKEEASGLINKTLKQN